MTQASGADILRFRSLLGTQYLAGMFRTPDNLASLVATAIARQGINKQIVARTLTLEPVTDAMAAFAQGSAGADNPSTIESIPFLPAASGKWPPAGSACHPTGHSGTKPPGPSAGPRR